MKKISDTSNLMIEYSFRAIVTAASGNERERERADGEGGDTDATKKSGGAIMALCVLNLLILLCFSLHAVNRQQHDKDVEPPPGVLPLSSHAPNRKLLIAGGGAAPEAGGGGGEFRTDRIGDVCTTQDVALHQGATTPLPSGIPTYTVRVINVCVTGCSISDVHLACGWFSTARSINPAIFRRLRYNDCLVNDGKPIPAGGSVSFQYAQTYPYTLSVSSATCNP